MKQKLLRVSILLGVLVLFGGVSQTVLAEDSAVPEVKTEATTETTSDVAPTGSTKGTEEPHTVPSETVVVPESSVTKEGVKKIEEDVESLITEQIGEKKGADVPLKEVYTASDIRDMLLNNDTGMTKEMLDKYSDVQLEEAMTLFIRYNLDISGMDPGGLARLVKTLYIDKTVSIKDALGQLSFNPSSFNSFADMITQIEALQMYLKTLYPSNSSFIAGDILSNKELIATLNHLETFERKIKEDGGELGAGRIVYILNAEAYGLTSNSTDTSTTDSKKAGPTSVSSSEAPKKDDEKKGGLLTLPQTGEEKAKWAVSILGIILVIGVIVFLVRRNQASKTK